MFKSHSQPPILHASKEARSIGLQYYELSFEAKTAAMIGQVDVEISIPPRVYVHWEYDIICPMPIKNIEEFRLRIHDQFVFSLEYFRTSPKIRRLALSTKRAEIGNILFSPLTALEEVLLYHEVPELDRRFGINDPISLELVQVVEKVKVEQEDSTQERHLRFSYLRRVIPVFFLWSVPDQRRSGKFWKNSSWMESTGFHTLVHDHQEAFGSGSRRSGLGLARWLRNVARLDRVEQAKFWQTMNSQKQNTTLSSDNERKESIAAEHWICIMRQFRLGQSLGTPPATIGVCNNANTLTKLAKPSGLP
jgi:hypothetical protein